MATKPKRIEDMSEAELTRLSTAAYDKAMPEPDTTFGKLRGDMRQAYKDTDAAYKSMDSMNEARKSQEVKDIEKRNAEKGATFKENMGAGRFDEMGNAYKKGGKVNSASRRADGIASKGKTKGRMV
jgi:hypothetical protein